MLDADRIGRPGVKRLWDVLPEQKCRLPKQHEPAELALAKRTHLQISREHVAGEFAAGCLRAPVIPGISRTQVWIDLVVRRSQVKLRVTPECIVRKEGAVGCVSHRFTLCL